MKSSFHENYEIIHLTKIMGQYTKILPKLQQQICDIISTFCRNCSLTLVSKTTNTISKLCYPTFHKMVRQEKNHIQWRYKLGLKNTKPQCVLY